MKKFLICATILVASGIGLRFYMKKVDKVVQQTLL